MGFIKGTQTLFLIGSLILTFTACSSSNNNNDDKQKNGAQNTPFTLNFKAISNGLEINCDDIYSGLGPNGDYSVGVGDLRFYVSNLKFHTANNEAIAATIDDSDFQLNHDAGAVALIDFSHRGSGFCADSQLGTPRTNTTITGTSIDASSITAISFDIGVPQAVMKAIIADSNTLTDAPSPLAEMDWSWRGGYRHLDINFTAMNSVNTDMTENSFFHIGSKDCGTALKALDEQDACGLLYTPQVMLNNFNPSTNTITFDVAALLANTAESDYSAMIMSQIVNGDDSACINDVRHGDMCPTGMTFGITCHSKSSESACTPAFESLGLNIETGLADSASNTVFGME